MARPAAYTGRAIIIVAVGALERGGRTWQVIRSAPGPQLDAVAGQGLVECSDVEVGAFFQCQSHRAVGQECLLVGQCPGSLDGDESAAERHPP
ncbi:hypothetical protein GCM10027187_73370 [Streptosporangium sandarakinum]